MKKRILGALCALCLTASLFVTALAETYTITLTKDQAISDVPVVLDIPPQTPADVGVTPAQIVINAPVTNAAVEIKINGDAKTADLILLNSDGTYSLPEEFLTAKGTVYTLLPTKNATLTVLKKPPFTDISRTEWYAPGVYYVYHNGLMNGTGKTTFSRNGKINRSMIAAILWRQAGEPLPERAAFYSDVPSGKFYTDAMLWCAEQGILTSAQGKLLPNRAVTREQLAVILYRYCEAMGMDVSGKADLSPYSDSSKISNSAKAAMSWAVSEDIFSGNSKKLLLPGGTVTRDQMAVILMRFFA